MLFDVNCEVILKDFVFTTIDSEDSKGMTIEWDYDIKNYDEPAKMKVKIYNPDKKIISEIQQLDPVILSFGYEGKLANFFSGYLDKYEFIRDGVDSYLKITAVEQDVLIYKAVSVSYESKTDAKYIISDIVKRAGLNLKQLTLKSNIIYTTGYCVYGKPVNELREVVEDCSSKIKIEGKDVYVYDDDLNDREAVVFDYTSGLLEEPQPAVESTSKARKGNATLYTHKFKALAIPLVKKNSIVKVVGNELSMFGQVIEISIDDYEAEYKIRQREEKTNG